jgi:hypothetical protein
MIIIHLTIFSAAFSILFAFRNYNQIKEYNLAKLHWSSDSHAMELEYRQRWHSFQFGIQFLIGATISFTMFAADFSAFSSIGGGLYFGSVFWLVFESVLHFKLGLKWNHVDSNGLGETMKWAFGERAGLVQGVLKILLIAVSAMMVII